MKHNNLKSGFTLVELMVFFVFISLVLAASTPIITKRAKNLPLKIHHGKYICTPGHQAYYNSTRLVSEENVAQCTFKPPKRASLYKIEMIGGGAGGYDFTNNWEDTATGTGKYTMTGGYSGDGYTNLSDAQLWQVFYSADFTYTTTAAGGGMGQSLSTTYTGIGSPEIVRSKSCYPPTDYQTTCTGTKTVPCTKEVTDKDGNKTTIETTCQESYEYECTKTHYQDPDGLLEACGEYDARLRAAAAEIASWYACDTPDWCRTVAGFGITSSAHAVANAVPGSLVSLSTNSVASGSSGYGGSSMGMYVDGKVDMIDYSNGKAKMISPSDVRSYLSKFIGTYYKTGTTQYAGSCEGWGYHELNNHDGKFDSKNVGLPNSDSYKVGKWGYDVMHYNAIQGFGKCATNSKRATGGQGAFLSTDGESYIAASQHSSRRDGDDAAGISGSLASPYPVQVGVKSDRLPYASTKTKLNVRHHQVGNGGGAGDYKVFYVSNLGNDCIFSPSGGGRAVTIQDASSDITALENGLATSLSCNEGTLQLSVEGGKYDTGILEKAYSGFNYFNPDGTFKNPASFTTSAGGSGSNYVSNDVFTKYVLGNPGYGAGGGGSSITDRCTQPWGEYWLRREYTTGGGGMDIDRQDIPQKECNEATDVIKGPANGGSAGAIIITW